MKRSLKDRAIYPGSFDPVTNGHLDLIRRARRFFGEVTVAVAHQGTGKEPLFSVEERVALLKVSTRSMRGVVVEEFEGLVVDFARRKGATAMIRGVRMLSDFEYEFQMALTNRKLASDIETIFLMPSESSSYLSSRLIKEIATYGGDIRTFVPPHVVRAMREKLGGPRRAR